MLATAKQYAQALYETTQEKSQSEVDKIITNFVNVLAQAGQLKLQSAIIKKFETIYNQEHKIVEARVITCQKLEANFQEQLEQYLRKKYTAQKVIINHQVDKNIQGGIILEVKGERLDGSIQRQIRELKKKLAK